MKKKRKKKVKEKVVKSQPQNYISEESLPNDSVIY